MLGALKSLVMLPVAILEGIGGLLNIAAGKLIKPFHSVGETLEETGQEQLDNARDLV